MTLQVIGAGVGRTGTYSLKLALNRLGLGPCHHMEEVLLNRSVQVPLWTAASAGKPDWSAIYNGYRSAVDWPTAGFVPELAAAYPGAKFILTTRAPESWTDSFSETIYTLIAREAQAPAEMQPWLDMAFSVIARTGFPSGLDRSALLAAFENHGAAVRALFPPDRLLVYQVSEGWGPLCAFLGVPEPPGPFPRSNDRAEFWDRVAGMK